MILCQIAVTIQISRDVRKILSSCYQIAEKIHLHDCGNAGNNYHTCWAEPAQLGQRLLSRTRRTREISLLRGLHIHWHHTPLDLMSYITTYPSGLVVLPQCYKSPVDFTIKMPGTLQSALQGWHRANKTAGHVHIQPPRQQTALTSQHKSPI